VVWVPGANELPLAIDKIAQAKDYNALIALGAVIQGATPHAELINGQVSRSLAKTAMDRGLPVINGVICAGNLEQAIERRARRPATRAGARRWRPSRWRISTRPWRKPERI